MICECAFRLKHYYVCPMQHLIWALQHAFVVFSAKISTVVSELATEDSCNAMHHSRQQQFGGGLCQTTSCIECVSGFTWWHLPCRERE